MDKALDVFAANAKSVVLALVQQNVMLECLQPAAACDDARFAVQIANTTSCNVTT